MQPIKQRIWQPLWQGEQYVHGLWFSKHIYSLPQRQGLIVRYWQAGAQAYHFEQGDLLYWPTARQIRCSQLQGLPLCQLGSVLTSAPLSPQYIKTLTLADVYLVEGAAIIALQLNQAMCLDPASWLDLADYLLESTRALEIKQSSQSLQFPPAVQTIHQLLAGRIPEPAPERHQLIQALRDQQLSSPRQDKPGVSGQAVFQFLTLSSLALAHALKSLFAWLPSHSSAGGDATGHYRRPPAPSSDQPLATRPSGWPQFFKKMLMLGELSKIMGYQHAQYLKKMLSLFEQGNLEEALRHAIPLSECDQASSAQAGFLQPRNHFQLSGSQNGTLTRLLPLPPEWHIYLQNTYEAAFERFDQQGDVDKAVYVLAELLDQKSRALDYLEQHQRFGQAATLCMSWDLSAARAIRLFLLAGHPQQAYLLAVQSNEFAQAIQLVEKDQAGGALQLRQLWAETLIQQGCWLEAVEVIWTVESQREQAISWLKQAEHAQGGLGLRAWLQRLLLQPEQLVVELERARALCQPEQRGSFNLAIHIAIALYQKTRQVLPVALIRLWTPSVVLNWQQGYLVLSLKEIRRWIEWSANPGLRADLPHLSNLPKKVAPSNPVQALQQHPVPAPGLWPLADVWPLPGDYLLVALGEAGLVMLDASQTVCWRMSLPTHQIVLADSQQVALVLTKRAEYWQVSRLDMVTRQVTALGSAALQHMATTFDGIAWLTVQDQQIRIIDTRQSLQQLLFVPTALDAPALAIARQDASEYILIHTLNGYTLNHYRLPYRRLLASESIASIPVHERQPEQIVLNNQGQVIYFWFYPEATDAHAFQFLVWQGESRLIARPAGLGRYRRAKAYVFANWFVICCQLGDQVTWLFYNSTQDCLEARLIWDQALNPEIHSSQGEWVIFDQRGRLIRLNEKTGIITSMTLS